MPTKLYEILIETGLKVISCVIGARANNVDHPECGKKGGGTIQCSSLGDADIEYTEQVGHDMIKGLGVRERWVEADDL